MEIYFRLDTWSNLSLAMYLDPQDYQQLMGTVHEVKGVLHDIFNGFINEKAIQKRSLTVSLLPFFQFFISKTPQIFFQTTGTEWSELADEIERFIRYLLEEASIMEWYAFVSMSHNFIIHYKMLDEFLLYISALNRFKMARIL